MRSLVYRLTLISIGIVLSFGLMAAYLYAFYENPPLVILNDPVPVDKQQYQAGDRIIVRVEANIKSQAPSELFISWISTPAQAYPVSKIDMPGLPKGYRENTFPLVVVAQILLPGTYTLELTSVYEVSLLPNERKVLWHSQPFEVIPSPLASSTTPITAYVYLASPTTEIWVPEPTTPPLLTSTPDVTFQPLNEPPVAMPTPEPAGTFDSAAPTPPTEPPPGTSPLPPTETAVPILPAFPTPVASVPTGPSPDLPEVPIPPLPKLPIDLPTIPPVPIPPVIVPVPPIGLPRLTR